MVLWHAPAGGSKEGGGICRRWQWTGCLRTLGWLGRGQHPHPLLTLPSLLRS